MEKSREERKERGRKGGVDRRWDGGREGQS